MANSPLRLTVNSIPTGSSEPSPSGPQSPRRASPQRVDRTAPQRTSAVIAAPTAVPCPYGQFSDVTLSPVFGTPASTNSRGIDWQ